ncbi:YALIA101S02e15896g1_1 [Yarrowia lipolytica]|nr:YALIA101S02e15896g1_1 [Yarrowia lipolytica]
MSRDAASVSFRDIVLFSFFYGGSRGPTLTERGLVLWVHRSTVHLGTHTASPGYPLLHHDYICLAETLSFCHQAKTDWWFTT